MPESATGGDEELIRRRRAQMLVHSYAYYVMDTQLISDHQWQAWADELARINRPIGFYDKAFEGWDGSTGYHLPKEPWIHSKVLQLLRYQDRMRNAHKSHQVP